MVTLTFPTWMEPYRALATGKMTGEQWQALLRQLIWPVMGIAAFLLLWQLAAQRIDTSLGQFPGPADVWEQAGSLVDEHQASRAKEAAFHERQEKYIASRLQQQPEWEPVYRDYTGAPTFFDQIGTSLITVMSGFLLASLIAIPLGIVIGLSSTAYAAMNPLIQLFKPVSPLAWLPIVTMIVSALAAEGTDGLLPKSFIISAITVTLCSLWPTLINTSLGVSSIDKDLVSVSKVPKMNTWTKITKLVLPSALPLIFTGLRLSLGVGWMVLIAAEMLAQNPGLGKFVWDEFQNGSSQSLARIMVAVFTIGIIGFLLDRVMFALQSAFTFSNNR
ncbi:ABC transporter permease [uncultured Alcanivorax sp.]|uniref:ABC transporter permease n=1 Tax=uncultured Alcanivorax sp. TaxID=191215 RepID=UPI00260FE905|nr:ABC transporter permease [uncultured Alcanivorax sp.]